MSTSEEVSLELLLLDGSNYTSWSASVLDVFRTMGPQIEQIVDVSISPPHDDLIYLSREEVKCLQLNAQAANVLFSALSEDVLDAVIFGDGKPLGDAHIIWTTLKEMYGNSKCEESNLSLEKPLEECSTSSTNDEPQVILSKGLFDHATSTSSPTYDLLDGNEIVGENNIFTCGTSTFFSSCETNILKEEEACDQWKPNDESTLPRSSTLYTTSHIGLMGKCNAQPSQDNHEDMVKKLEKGSTDACIKPYQKGYKSNNGKVKEILKEVQSVQNVVVQPAAQTVAVSHPKGGSAAPRQNRKVPKAIKVQRQSKKTLITCFKCKKDGHHVRDCPLKKEEKGMSKIQEKKKMAHVKFSNMGHNASMCSNKVDDQATLPKNKTRRSKRKCYGCHEKGHEIGSCPNKKSEGLSSSTKRFISKVASKVQEEKARKSKNRLCYTCKGKGHLSKDCPMGNTSKLNLSIDLNMLRRPKNDTCARKVIGSPCASTQAIWVPKSLVTNHNGPNIVWVPNCA
ncbi:uncharacterized protein [Miscanthus floridulus]|uniref:uncharacterized protein n=1 Tax=Miscanthus floridulus TaxID=154761 RepID=UPI00345A708F